MSALSKEMAMDKLPSCIVPCCRAILPPPFMSGSHDITIMLYLSARYLASFYVCIRLSHIHAPARRIQHFFLPKLVSCNGMHHSRVGKMPAVISIFNTGLILRTHWPQKKRLDYSSDALLLVISSLNAHRWPSSSIHYMPR